MDECTSGAELLRTEIDPERSGHRGRTLEDVCVMTEDIELRLVDAPVP